MENRSHALAAGVFAIFFALACACTVWWFGQRHEATNTYQLETDGSVSGLNAESTVRYRGIKAGRVESIEQDADDPRYVVVTISLDKRYKLTQGTRAKLASQGITGLSYIALEDDNSKPTPLATVGGRLQRIPLQPGLLDTLEERLGQIAVALGDVSARLNLVLSEKNAANASRTLENIATASEGMKQLPELIANLRSLLSQENIKRLNNIVAQVEQVSGEAAPMAKDLRETVATFNALSQRLDRMLASDPGNASANLLPRANQMMREVTLAARRLSKVLDVLEDNPQALVFGRPAPVPGPGERGFAPGAVGVAGAAKQGEQK